MQGIGVEHTARLGVQAGRYQYLVLLLSSRHRHHHRLGTGGGTVVHRGIRDVHARELSHHALVLKDIVQGALRDLSLIRGVRGEKLGALQQAGHHRWHIVVVDPIAGKTGELPVLRRQLLEGVAHLQLAHLRRQLVVALEADAVRNLGIEAVEAVHPRLRHHRLQVILCMWKILVVH